MVCQQATGLQYSNRSELQTDDWCFQNWLVIHYACFEITQKWQIQVVEKQNTHKKTCLVGRGRRYGTRWRWWQGKWCWTWLRRPQQPTSSYNQQHTSVKDTNNSTAVKPSGRFIFLFEAGANWLLWLYSRLLNHPNCRYRTNWHTTFKVQHVKATVIRSYFPFNFSCMY